MKEKPLVLLPVAQRNNPLAMLLPVQKAALVLVPVVQLQSAGALHDALAPLTLVLAPVLPPVVAEAVLHPGDEVPFVDDPVGPLFLAFPVAVPVAPLALVGHFGRRVHAIALEDVVVEGALVGVPVDVGDHALAVLAVLEDVAFVNGPVVVAEVTLGVRVDRSDLVLAAVWGLGERDPGV